MFAEESRANASRKRQEQARERRRKLKEQQDKKKKQQQQQQQQANKNDGDENKNGNGSSLLKSTSISDEPASNIKKMATTDASSSTSSALASSSAVTKALEQRKIRTQQKLERSAAIIIQSAYRSHRSNRKLRGDQKALLEKRLGDLMTLTQLLERQNKKNYVPPPSLINMMVNQMLFVFFSIPRFRRVGDGDDEDVNGKEKDATNSPSHRLEYFSTMCHLTKADAKLISNMVQYAILPGILSSDEHLDPSIVWIETKDGRVKLRKILRLCCYVMFARMQRQLVVGTGTGSSNVNATAATSIASTSLVAAEEDLKVVHQLLSVLIGYHEHHRRHHGENDNAVNENVRLICREILLPPRKSYAHMKPGGVLHAGSRMQDLDLIRFLRSFLLYPSHQRNIPVIPPTAERDGEGCIMVVDRKRADGLFRIVMEETMHSDDLYLQSRFVAEIMTVPLLSWKVEKKTISQFVRGISSSGLSMGMGRAGADIVDSSPIFVTFLSAFIRRYPDQITRDVTVLFPRDDVPLTLCSSPASLILLANVIQFGVVSPNINSPGQASLDFEAATTFFHFISILCNEVPLAAFSSRQSELEWLNDGSHLTPVVISSVVRNQCQYLLHDTFIRQVCNHSIDTSALKIDEILSKKDSKDKKLEDEMISLRNESAVEVVAKEVNEKKGGFWQNSRWAKKVSKKMSAMFSNDKKMGRGGSGGDVLVNTSSISREFASGAKKHESMTVSTKETREFSDSLLLSITRTYAIIISRWGGGGTFRGSTTIKDNAAGKPNPKCPREQARGKIDPCIMPVLNVLCFSTPFIKASWVLIQSNPSIASDLEKLVDPMKRHTAIQASGLDVSMVGGQLSFNDNIGSVFLLLFNRLLAHALIVTDDIELHDLDQPMQLHQIRRCIILLKNLLRRACCLDGSCSSERNHVGLSLISSSAKVMRDLYDRSSRRLLCPPKLWIIDDLLEDEIIRCKSYDDYHSLLDTQVLKLCPFLVPFKRRLKLFEQIVSTNRISIQGRNDGYSFRPGVTVHIMRGRVLEDGLTHLNKLGPNLRRRIIVQYVNSAGATETGLDAGGLFKEFWTDLSNQSFDPNWALFLQTEDSNGYLFPNPSSRAAHGSDSIILFEFLGRILGKAIYENITIQPQFAHFFLSFLRGDYNFLHMLPDLSTMDRTLYNNLMFLKTYEGDASDLCLTFSVTKDDFGTNKEVALIPNGENLDVTNANKHRYIQLVAKHFVCDQVREQSEAFRRGLWDVIDRSWLSIFNEPELQVLISGSTDGEIDIDDMKANSHYAGGYTMFDRNIVRFWKVVRSFSKEQRADLLRFVTSCERPPPLGFGSMSPPFTIQRIAISNDNEKLPTASTCFNVLKLPTYSSERIQKQKLLYAIKSQSGFELT